MSKLDLISINNKSISKLHLYICKLYMLEKPMKVKIHRNAENLRKIKYFWLVPLLHYESDENTCQEPVSLWRIRNSTKLHSILKQSKIVTSQ